MHVQVMCLFVFRSFIATKSLQRLIMEEISLHFEMLGVHQAGRLRRYPPFGGWRGTVSSRRSRAMKKSELKGLIVCLAVGLVFPPLASYVYAQLPVGGGCSCDDTTGDIFDETCGSCTGTIKVPAQCSACCAGATCTKTNQTAQSNDAPVRGSRRSGQLPAQKHYFR